MRNFYVHTVALITMLFLAGCAKEAQKEHMSFDNLSSQAFACIKKKDYSTAIAHLNQILSRFPDDQNIARYKILLAECYFKEKYYAAAQELYENFQEFYPSDKRAEYAKYKSLLSMFHQTRPTDCDQTKTHETIQLCHEYLQNPNFNRYRKDVTEKLALCENKLFNKELYVFNFYLKHNNYNAAHNRLKYIKEKFLASNKDLEAPILYHECKLAQMEKKPDLVKQHLATLQESYPTSRFTQMAQGLTTHRPFIF